MMDDEADEALHDLNDPTRNSDDGDLNMTATRVNASVDFDIIDSDSDYDDSDSESDDSDSESDSDDDLIRVTMLALIEEQRQEQLRFDQELDENLAVISAGLAVLREYKATNGRFDRSTRSSELRGPAYVEDILNGERDEFHEITRMEEDAFYDLLGRLEREGLRSTKNMDKAEMPLIFLSVLGSGWTVKAVAERYRRSVSTVHDVVHAVLLAMAGYQRGRSLFHPSPPATDIRTSPLISAHIHPTALSLSALSALPLPATMPTA